MQAHQGRTLTASRPVTRERWIHLAGKALKEGVEIRALEGGIVIATSGSDVSRAYLLSPHEDGGEMRCACTANAEFGNPCKHLAKWALDTGRITLPPDAESGDTGETRA